MSDWTPKPGDRVILGARGRVAHRVDSVDRWPTIVRIVHHNGVTIASDWRRAPDDAPLRKRCARAMGVSDA